MVIMDMQDYLDDKIHEWNEKYARISHAVFYVDFLNSLLLLTFSSLTTYIVVYQRQRRDLFAVVALTCYILSQLIFCIYTFAS